MTRLCRKTVTLRTCAASQSSRKRSTRAQKTKMRKATTMKSKERKKTSTWTKTLKKTTRKRMNLRRLLRNQARKLSEPSLRSRKPSDRKRHNCAVLTELRLPQ